MYKGFLIDLDGTAYKGDKVIVETVNFVNKCHKYNIKVLFLTNNASKTQEEIYISLKNMGYKLTKEEIYTSAMAIGEYFKNKNLSDIYLIGDNGLKMEFRQRNIKFYSDLHYENQEDLKMIRKLKNVVIGYTKCLEYKDLACASLILKNNGDLYATNKDLKIPHSSGMIPGNGAFVNLLEEVGGVKSFVIGKPENVIMDLALKKIGLNKEDVCIIGDNYYTDILSGINNGIDTIFVETGVHSIEDLINISKQPNYKLKNLSEFELENND